MPYTAEISRANPSCFVFLIDQSGSMGDAIAGGQTAGKKADLVADSLNRLLSELSIKCAKEEGVRDYFDVSVLGYGAQVGPALSGALAGQELRRCLRSLESPARLESRMKKVSDGAGGLVDQEVKFPIWVDPVADGGTPMNEAIARAQRIIADWVNAHPSSFPPVVINLTDGEATDGDPSAAADQLKNLATTDGSILMFNLHVSSDGAASTTFPDNEASLPNDYAKTLFRMSSVLPEHMRAYAQQQGFSVSEATRGFVFNADVTSIVQFLDIGTRATDLR